MKIIPEQPVDVPHYWCTWNRQNAEGALRAGTAEALLDSSGAQLARDALTQETLDQWMRELHPQARADLLVVLDDGWDVPRCAAAEQKPWFGMMEPHADRFAGADGTTRLAGIVRRARELGWKGAGVWVCVQEPPRLFPHGALPAEREAWWAQLARRFGEAGATYWKCDWGQSSRDEEVRRMIARIARRENPALWVEHTVCRWPLNDWEKSKRMHVDVFRSGRTTLGYSDVWRTYDVLTPLSVPTTLERVARHLADAAIEPEVRGLIHCEDEAYLGAVLGCVLGIMRYPLPPALAGKPNPAFPPRFEQEGGGRAILGAQDEVARALRWGRVMPAWQAGTERCQLSAEYLEDSWNFAPMETTFSTVLGKEIRQQAPARVARGLALPEVRGSEDVPYVIASRHPNGACAVATLGRVDAQTGWRVPRAQVVMDVGDARGPVGVFGHLAQLEIRSRGIRATSRVWGQDLLANTAEEITGSVQVRAGAIVISGELIERVGLAGATPGDRSEPGLALAWE